MSFDLEERRRFLKGPGGKQLLYALGNSTSAFSWGRPPHDPDHRNGSIFFVNTGRALFGVTAKHVYEKYEQCVVERPVVCQIDNLVINPIERLVSKGVDCDIATFKITPEELKKLGRMTTPWPPVLPKVDEAVILAGLPGIEKRFPDLGYVDFGKVVLIAQVNSISDREISFVRPPDEDVIDTLGKGLPPRHYDMGGMSGGPMATLLERGGIISWAVSGVISQAHQDLEILKAGRADFIDANGEVTC